MKFTIPETSVTRAVEFTFNKKLFQISFVEGEQVHAAASFSFDTMKFNFVRTD